jgi:hypothetical protein|tara:strand:- start:6093 stop:6974 length:882 start_codon:yes stop_codon:yes gene_type:complete
MNERKILYNKKSAKKLGWSLEWFCAESFDETLIENVKDFQRSHNLAADGLVGQKTFRRIFTQLESEKNQEQEQHHNYVEHIICNGEKVQINWNKVITFDEQESLALPENCYRKTQNKRTPTLIVTHWDATLSAKHCFNILKKRKISSHFVIDNDGTIYQFVDTNHIAWHARGVNHTSIGIDFSNAFYTKYQKWYSKNGHGERPVINSKVHGRKLGEHLGYYKIQEDAYKALIKALCNHYNIPAVCPTAANGELLTTVCDDVKNKKFNGVICHYHITKRKIDCGGLELKKLLNE